MTRSDDWSPLVPPLGEAPVTDWIRHHMYRQLGALPDGTPYLCSPEELQTAAERKRDPSFEALRNQLRPRAHPRAQEFEALRMARLRMGHLRYGQCGRNLTDAVGSMIRRLEAYEQDGNLEHLVDVANLCEIEWIWPGHEKTWYEADLHVAHVQDAETCRWLLAEPYAVCGDRTVLIDVCDWCEGEFVSPKHPKAHFTALDCGGHWSLRNLPDTKAAPGGV